MPNGHGLGLRVEEHKPPRLMLERTLPPTVERVKKKLDLPIKYVTKYDQGREGACVGFGYSWMMSILNRRLYDARWLYLQAQLVDPFTDTPPAEGTTSDAGAQILITRGHRWVYGGYSFSPRVKEGISAVRWANPRNAVDELRTTISTGVPFGGGINWYSNFDAPVWSEERGWVIGEGNLGTIRGGHFTCYFGADDDLETFDMVNNWGHNYPIVKMPYKTLERMAMEDGDYAVITDR